ncbi:hypothetical protein D593_0900 [Streptococcus intermedius BA1]|nr:hypothetical protein D593_0900 [Streptococcus intermedius BA1]
MKKASVLTISSKFFWFNSIRLHLLRSLVLKFFVLCSREDSTCTTGVAVQ